MIRFIDFCLSLFGLVLLLPILVLILIIGLFDTGSPLFRQQRVGRNMKPFTLTKFRTMNKGTASVASHLANSSSITRFGAFLRRSKLDELPQLWNVVKGDMSLVGPRPNLYNQQDLIEQRKKYGVYDVRPGVTGLAQVMSIDMSTPELLAKTDREMIDSLKIRSYCKYIVMTLLGKGKGDRVS